MFLVPPFGRSNRDEDVSRVVVIGVEPFDQVFPFVAQVDPPSCNAHCRCTFQCQVDYTFENAWRASQLLNRLRACCNCAQVTDINSKNAHRLAAHVQRSSRTAAMSRPCRVDELHDAKCRNVAPMRCHQVVSQLPTVLQNGVPCKCG